ncbi:MAG: saccharopine dehydrogenase-like NADP-dependent oxidoreductase [Bacteroidia bacterium]|jgi:saccharopine dehydrogenase-like NADP-dependent oxidoreductase
MVNGTIFIAGAGGIGRAAALLLETNDALDAKIVLGDISQEQLDESLEWIKKGSPSTLIETFLMSTESDEKLKTALVKCDVLLDCLPGSFAPKMAKLALDCNTHYANLTEYVKETAEIAEIAKNAKTGFVLQTGLAPGYINILALKLYDSFVQDFGNQNVQKMQMKVGALSKNALAPHHYAFTWSPIGVATEYVKDAIIVRNNKRILVPALSGRNLLTIDGIVYEDNFTSGGAANLPSTLASKITSIDYKTLRYPGHYKWVEKTLGKLPISENRIEKLSQIMLDKIPVVDEDVVIIYASVIGKDDKGFLRSYEKSLKILPMQIHKQKLRAIQSTTASALCEIAYYLLSQNKSGVIYQTDIDKDAFLNGPFVRSVYGHYEST